MDETTVRERRAELREAAEWLLDKLDSPNTSHLTLSRAYRLVHSTGLRWDEAVVDLNRRNMLPAAVAAPLPGDE